jgi:pyruvate/2-oxoglutarate dehydrogenase complex dihydrolipoamide acyltransferase (E2) component
MRKEVIMPKVGLDMEEGTIQYWLKKVGDHVEKGEPLMEIETDKSVTEIESAVSGTLVEIVVPVGEPVEIAKTVAWIETDD